MPNKGKINVGHYRTTLTEIQSYKDFVSKLNREQCDLLRRIIKLRKEELTLLGHGDPKFRRQFLGAKIERVLMGANDCLTKK